MTPFIVGIGVSLLSGITLWWVQRLSAKADKASARVDALNDKINALELRVAAEMPDKDDLKDVNRRFEALESVVAEIRDMVIRLVALEERRK